MKLILFLTIIAVSNADKLGRGYLPPAHAQVSAGAEFLKTPIVVGEEAVVQNSPAEIIADHREAVNGVVQIGNHATYVTSERPQYQQQYVVRAERPQADSERAAAVLRQEYENNGESYSYVYETQNGIFGEESGVATDGVKAHGGFSYVGDDGLQYTIRYTADENGFHPEGDHLPTPPPIPEEILKSIEQNARDEAAGIFDDGSYDERKYGEADYNQYVVSSNVVPQGNVVIVNDGHAVAHEDTVLTNAVPVVTNAVPVVTNAVPVVTNTVPVYPRPIYRPVGVHQNLNRVVVNKAYLPPHSQPVIEDRSSSVFGSRNLNPTFNVKNGYQY